jgi:H+-transporting ATPase
LLHFLRFPCERVNGLWNGWNSLRIGDVVPADVVLIDGEGGIDQSALTGETVLKQTSEGGKVFGGCIVKRGEFTAIVVATGN